MSIIKSGSTDKIRYVSLVNHITGAPMLNYTISNIYGQYTREGKAPSTRTAMTALASGNAAHTDNRAYQVDPTGSPGLYRIDWPDAAFSAGVNSVILAVSATGCLPAFEQIDLESYNRADLYNKTVDVETDTQDIQGRLPASLVSGRMDSNMQAAANGVITAAVIATDAIDADSLAADAIAEINATVDQALIDYDAPTSAELVTEINSVQADIAALNNISAAQVNAEVDTALSDYGALKPTVAGRTLDVNVGGEAGIDLDNTSGSLAKGTDITGFNDLSEAQVNAQVLDVLNTDTFAEPGQENPPATTSLVKKIGYLYKLLRNKLTTENGVLKVYADDGTTVDQKSSVSTVGDVTTRTELETGP